MADDEHTPLRDARDDSSATAAAAAPAEAHAPPTGEEAVANGEGQQQQQETETEENQYGLQDLEKLPLLEQVHRLFHAIQMKYPYKETAAWTSLPVDQKKRMLEYIRDKRVRKAATKAKALAATVPDPPTATASASLSTPLAAATVAAPVVTSAVAPNGSAATASAPAVKTDPYLQMLQRRSITTAPPPSSRAAGPLSSETLGAPHPNSAYIAPAQVAQYTDRKSRTARWKVVDSEFYDEKCGACGVVHKEFDGAKGALLNTMGAMMSTFGDYGRPCALAVQQVKDLVGEHLRTMLGQAEPEELSAGPGLRTLVEVFYEEAAYYGRWREFRGESKHEQNELEDVEEDELAEELDLFAVSEADSVFNEAFLERIKFADERTKAMDWTIYDTFARGRKLNFMSSKGQQFRHWLRIGKCSRASLEFMNFVAYHNIGRLVELAIKHLHGGALQAMASPLIKSDIQAVVGAFLSAAQPSSRRIDGDNDEDVGDEEDASVPVKVRRVSTKDGDITITERVTTSSVPASSSGSAAATTLSTSSSPERVPSSQSSSSETKARPTRLKRLR